MLRELGYELVEEPSSAVGGRPPPRSCRPCAASTRAPRATIPRRRCPRYDLEEIGPEDVALRSYSEPSQRAAAPAQRDPADAPVLDDIDDPFGEAPLPSFPLEPAPPESEAAFDLMPEAPAEDVTSRSRDPRRRRRARRPPRRSSRTALEEAEFFTSRGLFDDARTVIQEQLARLPNHPLLLERLAEIDAQERGVAERLGHAPVPWPRVGRPLLRHRRVARRARRGRPRERLRPGHRLRGGRRSGRRRGGVREVQGGRRQADRRRRRAEPLRPGRRLQGDGPRRRRRARVRHRRARPEARVRLPLDDRA